ncbi:MAG: MFS transporter [Corynebacterium glucuronolyticum]|nr:MFS transporter [Corynebacterium glucuronolyticum]MDD7586273.1 MFS transporter [Mycobacteriaceae bacterium]MDY5834123.1 MFS transporter [Corynebacterium glucuronolyticum]
MTTKQAATRETYQGTDKALVGIVLGVMTFWLFAQSTLNVGPLMAKDVGIPMHIMNVAISASGLFSGMCIVVAGGFADRWGRKRVAMIGNLINIVGSLLVATAFGPFGTTMMIGGRIFQGIAAASIMPSTMALVQTYWKGRDRQRALSMWSIGSWGGGGICAVFGGALASSALGWRSIFFLCAAVSVVSILLMREMPEAKANVKTTGFDIKGIISLMITIVALQLIITQGASFGWLSPTVIGLLVTFIVAFWFFVRMETDNNSAFVDFRLFRNKTFSATCVVNAIMNATSGILAAFLWVMQDGASYSAGQAGLITLGYAIFVVSFIRVGEKMMQRYNVRTPMLLGCSIVFVSILMLMFTNVMTGTYVVIAAVAFSLYGLGLGLFATPVTDAALCGLPEDQYGSGAGIFKMASSLGAGLGAAIAAATYTALKETGSGLPSMILDFIGRQDNLSIREAGFMALGTNAVMCAIAITLILVFIPKVTQTSESLDGEVNADSAKACEECPDGVAVFRDDELAA